MNITDYYKKCEKDEKNDNQNFEEIKLKKGVLKIYHNFVNVDLLKKIEEELNKLDYTQYILKVRGHNYKSPRLNTFIGNIEENKTLSYKYSNSEFFAVQWNETFQKLSNEITNITKEPYNCILINYYRDGNDYIAYHKDDEKDLVNEYIPCLSIGCKRFFSLKDKYTKHEEKIDKYVFNNDLVIINKEINKNYYHLILKSKINDLRISLTFRYIKCK